MTSAPITTETRFRVTRNDNRVGGNQGDFEVGDVVTLSANWLRGGRADPDDDGEVWVLPVGGGEPGYTLLDALERIEDEPAPRVKVTKETHTVTAEVETITLTLTREEAAALVVLSGFVGGGSSARGFICELGHDISAALSGPDEGGVYWMSAADAFGWTAEGTVYINSKDATTRECGCA